MSSDIFPRLSLCHADIKPSYDVVVVGSGYGGSIAASRCARAGKTVCVLERGGEWLPGQFPENLRTARNDIEIHSNHWWNTYLDQHPTHLWELSVGEDIQVLTGRGLGGGSLINCNVYIEPDVRVYQDPRWPNEIREDMVTIGTVDRRHVEEMLRPTVYPESYPRLKKVDLMKQGAKGLMATLNASCDDGQDIEDLERIFKKLPLYVNFDAEKAKKSDDRFDQPACNGCGNCASGCNTGAKNTLNMNYLPDAKVHGADLFTHISVVSVQRNTNTNLWNVFYKRHVPETSENFHLDEHLVQAKYVILGAGSMGSTKILIQSKSRGLEISGKLGSKFSGNGDALAFSSKGRDCWIGLDTGMYEKVYDGVPGPSIVSGIDLRDLPQIPYENGMMIQDGTPPRIMKMAYNSLTFKLARIVAGITGINIDKDSTKIRQGFNKEDGVEEENEKEEKEENEVYDDFDADDEIKVKKSGLERTLAFLTMSHDDAGGQILLNGKGEPYVEWPGVGKEQNFNEISKRCSHISTTLGGTYVPNPLWTNVLGKKLVTVHPLGGCPMGDNGATGVVNHKGQVFVGDTDQVHDGLYVMDGAIVPSAVGVNPTATISILAERCCRLLAEDAGWTIDYKGRRSFKDIVGRPQHLPGFLMTERMAGHVTINGRPDNQESDCEFVVTIESDDIEAMINDPSHSAKVSGTVLCEGLSSKPLTISSGVFNLFVDSESDIDGKEMRYNFNLTSVEGKTYRFKGTKYVQKNTLLEIGWEDTTTLYVQIFMATQTSEEQIGSGILKNAVKDLAKQILTITITNTESTLEIAKWTAKFYKFFAGTIWSRFFNILGKSNLIDPDALPRQKRELNFNGATPEIYPAITPDNVPITLTRYNGGPKGPLLCLHGLSTSSAIYTHDTIPVNMVEYFTQNGYDVWVLDDRQSSLTTTTPPIYHMESIDGIGKYDVPAAVDTILEITCKKDLLLFGLCLGGFASMIAITSGLLEGKIRALVLSQTGLTAEGSITSWLKAIGHASEIVDKFGLHQPTAYTDKKAGWFDTMINFVVKGIAYSITAHKEHCESAVCHRLTTFLGLLFEHDKLSVGTHNHLHEMFGVGHHPYFQQMSAIVRKGKLVKRNEEDVYIPGVDTNGNFEMDVKELEWVRQLDIPIYMIIGEMNQLLKPSGVARTYDMLKKLHPNQDYVYATTPRYGHVDGIIGKHAVTDVWPELLSFLDKYPELEKCVP